MSGESDSKCKTIQQVCVIPFRRPEDENDSVEFCLITSLVKKRWIFPKGIIDPGETPDEAGLKEGWEEAGLRGRIVGTPLGKFNDQKWGCDLVVQVLLMEVSDAAEVWPEIDDRQRVWLARELALTKLKREQFKSFLRQACQQLGECETPP